MAPQPYMYTQTTPSFYPFYFYVIRENNSKNMYGPSVPAAAAAGAGGEAAAATAFAPPSAVEIAGCYRHVEAPTADGSAASQAARFSEAGISSNSNSRSGGGAGRGGCTRSHAWP